MAHGERRILTTHTGSLPRPEALIKSMYTKEEGVPIDAARLDAQIARAVDDIVRRQVAAGVDVVNDGEMSKPSYATYIKDRLSGFEGTSEPLVYGDLVDFPGMARRVFGDPGRSRRKTPGCNGPIAVKDARAAEIDAANLKTAMATAGATRGFMSAASPGVVSLFFKNTHYKSHEAYLQAIADAMQLKYESVAKAGFVLQIDCPDLAMGRHIQYREASLADFRKAAALHIEVLNHALRNIPPEQLRMHLCWGNYEGPHHCDVPLADIVDLVLTARPSMIAFEAANPRHAHESKVFETVKLPEERSSSRASSSRSRTSSSTPRSSRSGSGATSTWWASTR